MENIIKKDMLRTSNEESNRITKECIQTALINLIAVKPFDKITITELVLRSGVSRMSFYRNYKTKEDVIIDICTELKNQLSESIADNNFSDDPLKWYCDFFGKIKMHEKEFNLLFSSNMPQNITLKILSAAGDVFIKLSPTIQDEYKAAAWVGTIIGIVLHWFSLGMNESPEEMADLCLRIIHN